ncbi:MAG: protein-methionine-sulfoxide reductase catalytic subunit MsrP [Cellvibrionaceae bacterium]|nr:protein-methionine-sulfoxide reductase catalytic subunit MsrP [Cellvibrionaceae bacterium]
MVTPEAIYQQRRKFIKQATCLGLLFGSPAISLWANNHSSLAITPEEKATRYNNYYEFSTNKEAVATLAQDFTLKPWTLSIGGLVERPLQVAIEELDNAKEYIYRFRCVEGWSMVVPWLGIPLAALLQRSQPKPEAQFVRFETIFRPEEMIGQRRNTMPWPYVEGLRLDEALHPLTLLATGMYQKPLPAQNGGPLRLVVPWKYGFKSIKAIHKIELVANQPQTTWNQLSPNEYGFYANVNPAVAHPRWSQRREVRLGELKKIRTLPFNGYEKEVAHLYKTMDLSTYF